MKALKTNPWKPICFALIILMIAIAVWLRVSDQQNIRYGESQLLADTLDRWVEQINTKGSESFIQEGISPEAITDLAPGGNLIALDGAGKVLYKTSDDFIGNQTQLHIMLSPYESTLQSWSTRDGNYGDMDNTRLALLTDAQGNITGTLRCIESHDAPNLGQNLPKYSEYFPALNTAYYDDAREDLQDGWGHYNWNRVGTETAPSASTGDRIAQPLATPGPGESTVSRFGIQLPENVQVPLQTYDDDMDDYGRDMAPPDAAMAQKVKTYILWENANLSRAGNMRMVYSGPAWDGTQLLMIYPDSDAMHQSVQIFADTARLVERLSVLLGFLIALFILSLAAWVYVDAKRRGSRPALWGILTLIGNVVAWLVYMLVRPNGRAAKGCPKCGAAVKGNYAYCAHCGAQLCETCRQCGKVVEPSFHYCPSCGKQVEGMAEQAIEAP